MLKYGRELLQTNCPISFHGGLKTWMVPFCWQPNGQCNDLIEMGIRITNNIKIGVENANLCRKYARYAHFSEMCEKCGNKQNMRQSHTRIKLTCLACQVDLICVRVDKTKFIWVFCSASSYIWSWCSFLGSSWNEEVKCQLEQYL